MNAEAPLDVTRVRDWLTQTDDAFFELLGNYVYVHYFGARVDRMAESKVRTDIAKMGRAFFSSKKLDIQFLLGKETALRAQLDPSSGTDAEALALAIADVFQADHFGLPVPPLLIATAVVKTGAQEYVACAPAMLSSMSAWMRSTPMVRRSDNLLDA